MLAGAQLPSEGVLADEVRSATLDAMGPVVGHPGGGGQPDGLSAGPRADGRRAERSRASQLWRRALGAGVVAAAGLIAVLLVLVGGPMAVLSLPVAFAPAAAAIAPAALLGEPVGLPTLSFYAGRPGRRRDPRARGHAARRAGIRSGAARESDAWWRALLH